MAHARASIRTAVTAAVNGLATTGANVFTAFDKPKEQSVLPCLAVTFREEDINLDDAASMGASGNENNLNREIECHIEGYAGDEATLDTIAEEVETAIHTPANFVTVPTIDIKTGPQSIEFNDGEDGDKVIGVIDMIFLIQYRTAENAPATMT